MANERAAAARELLAELDQLERRAETSLAAASSIAETVRTTHLSMRQQLALQSLQHVPIDRLRETAKGLRLGPLADHGIRTVADVVRGNTHFSSIAGVGQESARQIRAAANQVQQAAVSAATVRLDIEARTPEQTELLIGVRHVTLVRDPAEGLDGHMAWFRSLESLRTRTHAATKSRLQRAFSSRASKQDADQALAALSAVGAQDEVVRFRAAVVALEEALGSRPSASSIWDDYLTNAAELLGALEEITGTRGEANHGHLTDEVVERVQAHPLDRSLLTVGLRGYQAFGAKFALAQERVILGDEMGLGKTIEALAVMAHLASEQHDRVMVVCPASVVANWRNEILRHSRLQPVICHGLDRDQAFTAWSKRAGVAITTFDGLKRFAPPESAEEGAARLPLLVVDEAHYTKNPGAQRSQAVARWARMEVVPASVEFEVAVPRLMPAGW